jgi:hypothetical protein
MLCNFDPGVNGQDEHALYAVDGTSVLVISKP